MPFVATSDSTEGFFHAVIDSDVFTSRSQKHPTFPLNSTMRILSAQYNESKKSILETEISCDRHSSHIWLQV